MKRVDPILPGGFYEVIIIIFICLKMTVLQIRLLFGLPFSSYFSFSLVFMNTVTSCYNISYLQ